MRRLRVAVFCTVFAASPILAGRAQVARSSERPAGERVPILQQVGIDQRLGQQVSLDLIFRDEGGHQVRLGDYFRTRPVILTLVYYQCPMLCTQVLNGLTSALSVLPFDVGDEMEVVTVSFDPAETPALAAAKKHAYLRRYGRAGAERGWHFLTGEATAIRHLAADVGFRYAFDATRNQFAHGAAIFVLTPTGKVARYFYGIEYAPRDLRLGLVEASANRIGSPIDQVLLYCYQYDPTTGTYGWVVLNLVRAGGIVTVFALGVFVIAALRREARARTRTESPEPEA